MPSPKPLECKTYRPSRAIRSARVSESHRVAERTLPWPKHTHIGACLLGALTDAVAPARDPMAGPHGWHGGPQVACLRQGAVCARIPPPPGCPSTCDGRKLKVGDGILPEVPRPRLMMPTTSRCSRAVGAIPCNSSQHSSARKFAIVDSGGSCAVADRHIPSPRVAPCSMRVSSAI